MSDLEPEFEQPKQRRRRRGGGMSREDMLDQYPSLRSLSAPPSKATQKAWVAVFDASPDVMHNLLADFIKQAHAQPGRIGQRPMPKEEQVDFEGLLYGDQTDLPMTEALPKLITVSQRAFCLRIHMSRKQFQRLLAGEYHPDVNEMRIIAQALKKPPTYFMEYRKAMVVSAFLNLIEERPGIATTLYRQYLEVRIRD